MSKIIWLASYPKSGNTWVRFIIANLIYGAVGRSSDVFRLIPDIHKGITDVHLIGQKTIFVKTHLKYFDGMPLRQDTVGAIYVVRNPLDVIASAVNYVALRELGRCGTISDGDRHVLGEAIVREFLERGALERWLRSGVGTWSEHVSSWHRKDLPFRRLTLRYEDMMQEPEAQVAHLCEFLGIDRSSSEIVRVLAASSFENMREMEEREVAASQPGLFATENPSSAFSRGLRFMNKGRIGAHHDILGPEKIDAAKKRFGSVMAQLGYEV
jgi:aryl sulfotransferase